MLKMLAVLVLLVVAVSVLGLASEIGERAYASPVVLADTWSESCFSRPLTGEHSMEAKQRGPQVLLASRSSSRRSPRTVGPRPAGTRQP